MFLWVIGPKGYCQMSQKDCYPYPSALLHFVAIYWRNTRDDRRPCRCSDQVEFWIPRRLDVQRVTAKVPRVLRMFILNKKGEIRLSLMECFTMAFRLVLLWISCLAQAWQIFKHFARRSSLVLSVLLVGNPNYSLDVQQTGNINIGCPQTFPQGSEPPFWQTQGWKILHWVKSCSGQSLLPSELNTSIYCRFIPKSFENQASYESMQLDWNYLNMSWSFHAKKIKRQSSIQLILSLNRRYQQHQNLHRTRSIVAH